MTLEQALAFVASHGVVLETARGPVPNLAETVVGEPIRGSWWGHPQSHKIYPIVHAVRDDPAVLKCRLVNGKVTYVHRRLWPALARLAPELDHRSIAAIREEHTQSGAHRVIETPFSEWLSADAQDAGRQLLREEAIDHLGSWIVPLLRRAETASPR